MRCRRWTEKSEKNWHRDANSYEIDVWREIWPSLYGPPFVRCPVFYASVDYERNANPLPPESIPDGAVWPVEGFVIGNRIADRTIEMVFPTTLPAADKNVILWRLPIPRGTQFPLRSNDAYERTLNKMDWLVENARGSWFQNISVDIGPLAGSSQHVYAYWNLYSRTHWDANFTFTPTIYSRSLTGVLTIETQSSVYLNSRYNECYKTPLGSGPGPFYEN